jgi:hypothetical protein
MADHYGSLEGAATYHSDRGNAAWAAAATDALRTAALVRASDYIKYRYVVNLACDYGDDLPEVEQATYVAALLELAMPGFFSKTYTEAEQKVLTEVKGIKWTVTGKTGGAFSAVPTSTLIEAMLGPYLAKPMPAVLVV